MSNPTPPSRSTRPSTRAALAVPALAAALALSGCSGAADSMPPGDTSSAGSSSAAPTPTWAAVKGPPRTIPAVSTFQAADGRGWRPSKGARVVVPAGEKSNVADEARRLAKDLGGLPVVWGDQDVRPGDVEVKLTGKSGADRPDNAAVSNTADEAYTLTADGTRLTLTAPTDAGIFYGTRTVKQALRTGGGLPEGTIQDRPDRPQRGMSLDNARKPFSADWIESRIREIADLKLNQFQLHFSDDQGFRIESDTHPEIVSADHLTKAQVRSIVRSRGACTSASSRRSTRPATWAPCSTTIPICSCATPRARPSTARSTSPTPQAGPLIDALLREYAGLFTNPKGSDAYWHLGGDEYQALMSRSPETSYPQLAQAAREKYGIRRHHRGPGAPAGSTTGRRSSEAGKNRVEAWNDGFFFGGAVRPTRTGPSTTGPARRWASATRRNSSARAAPS